MALREKRVQALKLRKLGKSYSQIKDTLKVSKSSLSLWLRDYPLSEERTRELRDFSSRRIERYRETMRLKRESKFREVREQVRGKVGGLSKRELLIGGLFLYWGEGGKTKYTTVELSNTDPAMILCFMKWLQLIGVSKKDMRVHLHVYQDMDVQYEIGYWSRVLKLPRSAFRKPYVKKTSRKDIKYFQRFTHGTCGLIVESKKVADFTLHGYEIVRTGFIRNVRL